MIGVSHWFCASPVPQQWEIGSSAHTRATGGTFGCQNVAALRDWDPVFSSKWLLDASCSTLPYLRVSSVVHVKAFGRVPFSKCTRFAVSCVNFIRKTVGESFIRWVFFGKCFSVWACLFGFDLGLCSMMSVFRFCIHVFCILQTDEK